MLQSLYYYHANITYVYDGDTCTADIDLGLDVWKKSEKIRLNRINTPELRGDEREAGLVSRDRLRELVQGKEVIIQTVKDRREKYGRYLGEIWLMDETGKFNNINDQLVAEGLAEYYLTSDTEPLVFDLE